MLHHIVVPPRPPFPNQASRDRADHQRLRAAMLDHDFQEEAAEWSRRAYGEENAQALALIDTSLAPLPAQTKQLTTPGLYGRWPTVTGEDEGDRMLDPHGGVLKRCGYWSRMAHVEYMTVGIGVYAQRLNVVGVGDKARPVVRVANPFDLEVWCRDDDPLTPIELWELKLRVWRDPGGAVISGWLYDVFDITDPDNPSFRICEAAYDGRLGKDRTGDFLDEEASGEGYIWRTPDGEPFLPYAWYRAVDTGEFWPKHRRGLHQGTLRACAHWTHASNSALWASGEHNLVGGVDPEAFPSSGTAGENDHQEISIGISTFHARPGAVTVIPTIEDRPLQVYQLKAGVNLTSVANFANLYSTLMAHGDGLSPSDATRRSANPTSGAALTISNADKRAHSLRTAPMFMTADQDAIRKLAWLMEIATGETHTAEGYSIEYQTLPLSPTEQADQRDQLEWEKDQGQLSPIDLHLRLHPTKTREQAIEDIVGARADEREIEVLVERELERRGVPAAPTPQPQDMPEEPGNNSPEPNTDDLEEV